MNYGKVLRVLVYASLATLFLNKVYESFRKLQNPKMTLAEETVSYSILLGGTLVAQARSTGSHRQDPLSVGHRLPCISSQSKSS